MFVTRSNGALGLGLSISLFIFASLTYNTTDLRAVGYVFIILGVIVAAFVCIQNKKLQLNLNQLIVWGALLSVLIISICRKFSFEAVEKLFLLLIAFIILNVFSSSQIVDLGLKNAKYIIGIILIIMYIPMLLGTGINEIDGGYKSIYSTTTFLGLFSCLAIEICFILRSKLKGKIWWIYIALFAFLVIKTKVRTATIGLLALFLFILFDFILKKRNSKPKVYKLLKWGAYLTIVAFVFIYPDLQNYSWFYELSNWVYSTTGKILLSGREILWKDAFELIKNKPIFGYGGDLFSVYFDSVHSSYLLILLKYGAVGLFFVWRIIDNVLNRMLKRVNAFSEYCFLFSLVNLLLCTNEVMLIEGQIILQIIIWIIFALGINPYIEKREDIRCN